MIKKGFNLCAGEDTCLIKLTEVFFDRRLGFIFGVGEDTRTIKIA